MKLKIKSFIRWGILLIALILIFSLIKSITKIVNSNQKITEAAQKLDALKKENKSLTKDLEAANSIQFVEKQARDKLGLAKAGEIVVVLPDADTLKKYAPQMPEEKLTLPAANWQKWLKLFL